MTSPMRSSTAAIWALAAGVGGGLGVRDVLGVAHAADVDDRQRAGVEVDEQRLVRPRRVAVDGAVGHRGGDGGTRPDRLDADVGGGGGLAEHAEAGVELAPRGGLDVGLPVRHDAAGRLARSARRALLHRARSPGGGPRPGRPAETPSQPSTGQVLVSTERIDMAALEPSRSSVQRFGVASSETSVQVMPPVPMRTVAPNGAAAEAGRVADARRRVRAPPRQRSAGRPGLDESRGGSYGGRVGATRARGTGRLSR